MKHEFINELSALFGDNFIGPAQVNTLLSTMNLAQLNESDIPELTYSFDFLKSKARDYLLVMGYGGTPGSPLSILAFRDAFGIDPDKREPCLYNQDWYLAEDFVNRTLENRWYLIKRQVIESSRAISPADLIEQSIRFPSAILCTYSFFACYLAYGQYLWYHDFVWCSDLDHNGDRIYVGKYHDVDGVNKNGFSIHRHLALRPCYAAVSIE